MEALTHVADDPAAQGVRLGPVEVWHGAHTGKYPDGNLVVVTGSDARASFDLPLVSRTLPGKLEGVDLVVLSHVHEDHTAGLGLLPRTPVHVHELDAPALRSAEGLAVHYGYGPATNRAMCDRAHTTFHFSPRPDACSFRDGATWDLGGVRVRAIHAPGHTSGHCVLLVEPVGVAFIADIDLSSFGPYYGDATSDLASFRQSLDLVRRIPATCWITSHHKGVVADRGRFLALLGAFTAALQHREEALLQALAAEPMTLAALVQRRFVYRRPFDDVFVDDVERRVILQHLAELIGQGRVVREGPAYRALRG